MEQTRKSKLVMRLRAGRAGDGWLPTRMLGSSRNAGASRPDSNAATTVLPCCCGRLLLCGRGAGKRNRGRGAVRQAHGDRSRRKRPSPLHSTFSTVHCKPISNMYTVRCLHACAARHNTLLPPLPPPSKRSSIGRKQCVIITHPPAAHITRRTSHVESSRSQTSCCSASTQRRLPPTLLALAGCTSRQ